MKQCTAIESVYFLAFIMLCATGAAHLSSAASAQETVLILTTPEGEGVLTVYQKTVYQELGQRTGLTITIKELPKKRALVDADRGKYHGVAARIRGLEKLGHENLKIVDVSHVVVQHVVFAKSQDIRYSVTDIDSLIAAAMRSGFRIGFLRGSKKAQLLLSTLPDKYKMPLNSNNEAFLRLQRGTLGAYLGGPGMIERAILAGEFSESGIHEVAIVSQTELFPYLHSQYEQLIPKFEKALRAMQAEGRFEDIRQSLLSTPQ